LFVAADNLAVMAMGVSSKMIKAKENCMMIDDSLVATGVIVGDLLFIQHT
jgi:hypothetical protein